jgi:hypothetical protein
MNGRMFSGMEILIKFTRKRIRLLLFPETFVLFKADSMNFLADFQLVTRRLVLVRSAFSN